MEKENDLVLDVEQSPTRIKDWLLFSIQHILAMLVACITVPLLTGLPIAATLISAGIGTIFYIVITKFKSPVFLSSSFAYLSPMSSALAIGLVNKAGEVDGSMNYLALILGMVMVCAVYAIIALIVKFVGTKWINKLLPPIIVCPIIMVIGLSLSSSAVSFITTDNNSNYNLMALVCGMVALVVTALCSHYSKKMLKLIPFVIGITAGYLFALIVTLIGYTACGNEYFNLVDFTPFVELYSPDKISLASFINYKLFVPNDSESFIFLRFNEISRFDWSTIGQVMLLFIPVSLVTVCEHIGDHENLGNIIHRDLLNKEPGMHRTLLGDGIATGVSGVLCGAANTTYGENVAVVGMTKIASTKVVFSAAIMTIIIGFLTPFSTLLRTIPHCVTGGVALVLYGFIASSGIKMLISERIDFNNTKNIFVASVILVAGIGGLVLKFGNPNNPTIQITSIAVSMILGIFFNLILKDKKNESVQILNNNDKKE